MVWYKYMTVRWHPIVIDPAQRALSRHETWATQTWEVHKPGRASDASGIGSDQIRLNLLVTIFAFSLLNTSTGKSQVASSAKTGAMGRNWARERGQA